MSPDPNFPSPRAKLAAEIDLVPWRELRSHALADRVFLVGPDLELLDVAVAVACDAAGEVAAWTRGGDLARPSQEQMTAWEETPAPVFRCVIVAPFVLVQRTTGSARPS